MKTVVVLAEVRTFETRSGNVGYVGGDADGKEYTTFREDIGVRAKELQNRHVRIEYHEERRGQYKNVYLDKIEPAEPERAAAEGTDTDPQEAAWRTAVQAAPWLVGEPREAVPPGKLYDKLKPFEERVAADIKDKRTEGEG